MSHNLKIWELKAIEACKERRSNNDVEKRKMEWKFRLNLTFSIIRISLENDVFNPAGN